MLTAALALLLAGALVCIWVLHRDRAAAREIIIRLNHVRAELAVANVEQHQRAAILEAERDAARRELDAVLADNQTLRAESQTLRRTPTRPTQPPGGQQL